MEHSNVLHTPVAKEKGAKRGDPYNASTMDVDQVAKKSRKEATSNTIN